MTTPLTGSLEVVPEISAAADPTDVSFTSTVALESRTGFPEISFRVTTGTWAIPARFTTPVASVVKSIWVATPCVSVTVDGEEVTDGLDMEAVTIFSPVLPTNFNSWKVAMPSLALSWRLPVRSVPARVTSGLPEVTRFSLASSSSTTTPEIIWSFAALSWMAKTSSATTP